MKKLLLLVLCLLPVSVHAETIISKIYTTSISTDKTCTVVVSKFDKHDSSCVYKDTITIQLKGKELWSRDINIIRHKKLYDVNSSLHVYEIVYDANNMIQSINSYMDAKLIDDIIRDDNSSQHVNFDHVRKVTRQSIAEHKNY